MSCFPCMKIAYFVPWRGYTKLTCGSLRYQEYRSALCHIEINSYFILFSKIYFVIVYSLCAVDIVQHQSDLYWLHTDIKPL